MSSRDHGLTVRRQSHSSDYSCVILSGQRLSDKHRHKACCKSKVFPHLRVISITCAISEPRERVEKGSGEMGVGSDRTARRRGNTV